MTTPVEDHGIPWKIDDAEIVQSIMATGIDPMEAVTEFLQNAIDSPLPPTQDSIHMTREQANSLPNVIDLIIPDMRSNIVFIGQDHGLSIAKDYDYDIDKFLNAAKGTSTKREHPLSSGRKGLRMFQYLHLAKKIEIVSQDTKKGCLYKFTIHWGMKEGKKFPFFSERDYVAITPEAQKQFGIFARGTKLTFYDPTDEAKEIPNFKEAAIAKILDTFGLIMAERPNTIIKVNSKRLEPPNTLIKHRENQIVPSLGISGNLYEDRNGIGEVAIFGQGRMRIMNYNFRPYRRFSGYLVCESWIPDTGRKLVKLDKHWKDSMNELNKYVEKFRKVQIVDESYGSDRKILNMFEYFTPHALSDLLPKAVVQGSLDRRPIKNRTTGHLLPEKNEDQSPGYPEPKPRMENHPFKNRKKHRRDNTNQQFVGLFGIQRVMRASESTDQNQEKSPPIVYKKQKLGPHVKLMDLVTDVRPLVLYINTDNPLYSQKFTGLRNRKEFVQRIAEQLAILRMQILQELGRLPKMMGLEEFRRELEKNTSAVLNS